MATAKSPKQLITDQFGSRAKAVDAINKLLGGDKETKSRLQGTTNKKLLRIHAVATEVNAKFGGKSQLIEAIAKLKFPKGAPSADWTNKMESFTIKRLLDVHRQAASNG